MADDFLNPPEGSWAKKMVDEVIEPAQEASLRQEFLREIQDGTAPRERLAQMGAEMLWVTNHFGNWVAALGARCPATDHFTKILLLKNAVEESEHPPMLVKFLRALGYDAEGLLTDPLHPHNPTQHGQALVDFLTATCYHRPFEEGVAAVGSMEAVNPGQSRVVHEALVQQYGLNEDDVEWAAVHESEIEQAHAKGALMIVERYIGDNELLRSRCEYAIRRGVYLAGNMLDGIARDPLDITSLRPLTPA